MRGLYIFTAGDAEARKHLDDSIRSPQPSTLLDEYLSTDSAAELRSLLVDPNYFYAWGAVPGPRNIPIWEQMQDGDIVLTVFGNRYRYISSVIAKIHNADLARAIWGVSDKGPEGKTWEYMYVLSEPRPIDVHVTSSPVKNHLHNGYRGFSRIGGDRLSSIRAAYSSLEGFVEEVFSAAIPPSVSEREIVEAEDVLEATAFDADSTVDGRRKVIAEVVRRRGQPKFRKELINAYAGKCALTGCEVEDVLEAAHIIGYLGSHTNHVSNGLLLRADVHTLFDLGMLKIDAKGRVHIADALAGSMYEHYEGKSIRFPTEQNSRPHPGALAKKFSQLV